MTAAMSNLPPYSTFRTDSKQMMFPQATSHGNILTFTPPGFKQTLNVKFPDSRLAVCEKCKKNFKTRDMCRVRNTHTSPPWTTAFICLTLDDSCTDSNGNYIDKPFTVRMVQWQPFCVKDPFDPKTPVCAACKKTNRTRSFCRERHKHRQLPWCTVYVLLSALDTADPSTVVAAPSTPVDSTVCPRVEGDGDKPAPEGGPAIETKEGSNGKADNPISPTNAGAPDEASATESKASLDGTPENVRPNDGKKGSGDKEVGDSVFDIAESRTFLAKVSCKGTTIHWLELADFEGNEAAAMTMQQPDPAYGVHPGAMAVPPVDPNQAQYYHHAMGYAAQQHQNALKSHQQYFFQMQQRHQHPYPPHPAWQAHYNQPHMPMHGQPPPPHPPPPPPPPHAALPPPPQPAPPAQDGSPAPAPVTAGEAAAQQQKRNRQIAEDGTSATPQQGPPPPPPPPPAAAPPGHPLPPPPGHALPPPPPHGQQQQQQQWMLYQQMYQAQLPPMAQPPPQYPPRPGQPPEGSAQGVHGVMPNNNQQYNNAPQQAPQGNGKANNQDSDSKRQRLA